MKKLFTSLLCTAAVATAFAQWSPATFQGERLRANTEIKNYYKLDIGQIRSQLAAAPEMGKGGRAVEVSIPTMDGKVERFSVYSFPVVSKDLADAYQLGSYIGVGIDDPAKYVRFSVAPNNFQSMIIKDGKYEFVEPQDKAKTVYGVHYKTYNNDSKYGFVCTTTEPANSKEDLTKMMSSDKPFPFSQNNQAKMSDQKFRTMRLAMSVTGEYTQLFGGVPQALAQVNATMTRVNGVYERELALHLNVIYAPQLIYTDPATDPYSPPSGMSSWNLQLQKTLTAVVGEANYDIGHLFGASGGGGNAGCIGCVCVSPTVDANGVATSKAKGSGITSPADSKPYGDNFDIDYVAHEMGHQLGGNHTFSHGLEGTGVNVEPGSGTTIMGYAGITGINTDVQPHSDPWFSTVSINQIQTNLIAKTCDVEMATTDTPPAIEPMADINIPKGTAFYLTAKVTDAEKDPLLYSWEQIDNATVTTNRTNLGTTTTGPSFRVQNPTASPTRYFPKFEQVMTGVLNNASNTWEAVSTVARTTNFQILVRENNPLYAMQQTQNANQKVIVGKDGPFKVSTLRIYQDRPTSEIAWDVAATNAAPYNVANVKIDYTLDNGATWKVLAESTPNDGKEDFDFTSLTIGSTAKVRVSAIGNVFYTIGILPVAKYPVAVPNCVTLVSPANGSTTVSYQVPLTLTWTAATTGEPADAYDIYLDTNPNPTTLLGTTKDTTYTVPETAFAPSTQYYWKIVPKNIIGANTACPAVTFTTIPLTYCLASAVYSNYEKISKVEFADIAKTSSATSTAPGYEDFTSTVGNVTAGQTYTFKATYSGSSYATDQALVWIDLNNDKDFDDAGENVLVTAKSKSPWTGSITIPATATPGMTRMRIRLQDTDTGTLPNVTPCGINGYGQVEDYSLNISAAVLASNEVSAKNGLSVYPNPATDILNISNVSAKAQYSVYSMNGALVSKGTVSNGKINVSSLVKGVYVLTVQDGEGKSTTKFIKN